MNAESSKGIMTPAVKALPNLRGFYIVTAEGQLGVFGGNGEFIPDQWLTEALAPQLRELLTSYRRDPQNHVARIGLVYQAIEPRPWSGASLLLEDAVVRELYPVGGPPSRELTAFQKKNREKSVYRGLELLIEYRNDAAPEEIVYGPLLYDRGTTLAHYPWASPSGAAANAVRVLEVLNLMSAVPSGRRNTPEIAELVGRMRGDLIRKDLRRATGFTLAELRVSASGGTGGEFFDVDKRHEREVPWPERLAAAERMQEAERVAQVERWLERPHRPVDPALLRRFLPFRDLESDRLALLASKAFVHTAPSGTPLLRVGMKDAWNMYLLEGTVSLAAADGGTLLVTGGDAKAESPISFLKPRKYTVTSVTPVSFLWVHDALLAAVFPPPGPQTRPALAVRR